MKILCVGLSFRTAPLSLRERLCYSHASLSATLARFGCGHEARPAELSELVITSTCNRLEAYAVSNVEDFEPLLNLISETTGVARAEFAPAFYSYVGEDAAEHLCRVAAGLDSMVLGEPQILGQVTEAYSLALGHGACGGTLSSLMRAAIHAGKRARTETGISRNPATISSIAVKLAASTIGDLERAHVIVIGSGEMGELAVSSLRSRGVKQVTVVNRTHEHAQELAEKFDGATCTFERLPDALSDADIVITSTAAPHVVVPYEMVEYAMITRPDRPLVFVDIAVPRDVDPTVSKIKNVHCYDVDDLQGHLNSNVAVRESEVPGVEKIVAEEAANFMDWVKRLDITPVIADLRAHAENIRRAEVEKVLRQMSHLGETDRRKIEALTQLLVNKILHEPTVRLKAEATNGHATEFAAAVCQLFGLAK